MRGATTAQKMTPRYRLISIHAPHARSDWTAFPVDVEPYDISIHAPHARSDTRLPWHSCPVHRRFQSTLLMRGATWSFQLILSTACGFQSTLLMRGATGWRRRGQVRRCCISIHAPHARSDESSSRIASALASDFNPRSSCEERLVQGSLRVARRVISIHAPHARSDLIGIKVVAAPVNFNPRSSCEERHHCGKPQSRKSYFNPRSSCEERLSVYIGELSS